MPAGGKGDEPYLDIVVYKTKVFSEKADNLVRDLSILMSAQELLKFRSELMKIRESRNLNVNKLENELETRKSELLNRAAKNGLDLELLESEMRKRREGNFQ